MLLQSDHHFLAYPRRNPSGQFCWVNSGMATTGQEMTAILSVLSHNIQEDPAEGTAQF
jgi:hypothetical protein